MDKPLTNEELCAVARNGDAEAGNLLIERSTGFIVMIVRSVLNLFGCRPWELGVTYDDLIQEGRVAMWNCVDKYDPEKRANFLTYAKPAIRHAVIDFIREQRQEAEDLQNRITVDALETRYGEGQRFTFWGDEPEMPDMVGDPFHQSPEQMLMDKELITQLYRALDRIDDRGSVFLRYRFGMDDGEPHSFSETMNHYGLTQGMARKDQKTALDQMRREMAG